jgi:hypothetical protein
VFYGMGDEETRVLGGGWIREGVSASRPEIGSAPEPLLAGARSA